MRSAVFVPLLGAAVVIVSGCSSAHPTSPSAPASTTASSAALSTPVRVLPAPAIEGVIRVAGRNVGVAALGMKPMRVSLAGTGMATMVDSRGRFSLKNLPVGAGRLRIQGAGVDTGVAVNLHDGRALQLAVRVSGTSAQVECENEVEERDGNNNDEEGQSLMNTCDDGDQHDADDDNENDDGEQEGDSSGSH